MSNMSILSATSISSWEAHADAFNQWLNNREAILDPGLSPQPTIKVLLFLALYDAKKACSYEDIREIFKTKNVINGIVPDNTLRTSMLNLGKCLDKSLHALELKSNRGRFELMPRIVPPSIQIADKTIIDPVVLLLDPPAIEAEDIAYDIIEKGMLPFHALYFLEHSARWWEIYSSDEAGARVQYESGAWKKLKIKERLFKSSHDVISFLSLAPGEGLAEIELLKNILAEDQNKKVHYLAIDSSQRLLRNHINLLKESLTSEIDNGRLVCAGVIANIFSGLREALSRARAELYSRNIVLSENDFFPVSSGILITYLGNCLGNNCQDQETEIFSIIHSTFQNRPLEFLVGASVMRSTPDEYKRNWDDFFLKTPKHLLEKKLLQSSKSDDQKNLDEFCLPLMERSVRCPPVIPEAYIVRHKIEGQIYRFYYKLAYDLSLSSELGKDLSPLPAGTLILLYNVIKYNIQTLIKGIEKCGLFKIQYDSSYHQIVDQNGIREYAVFCVFSDK